MFTGTWAGACAPSTTVTRPSTPARATISSTGSTSPVSEVTWLTKMTREWSLAAAKSVSTNSLGSRTGNGIRVLT